MQGKTIVLGVSGSIAAYKAADIASGLKDKGASVRVVMTKAAGAFITPLTLQTLSGHPVHTHSSEFSEQSHGCPSHIELAAAADLLLVAPATAHTLACFAQGLAPDILGGIYLATRAPVMLAAAMNTQMLQHPAVAANMDCLKARGVHFVPPQHSGVLACGTEGAGKLALPEVIIAAVEKLLS